MLTWNPIATLESLGVTDPFFSGGNQTCNYTHDDMSRIASANCGSPWAQTFRLRCASVTLARAGRFRFNRLIPISHEPHDADWQLNSNLRPERERHQRHGSHVFLGCKRQALDGRAPSGLTYDALGRMVEQDKSGVYSEIAYAPRGGKLAIMSGQTLQKAFVPLSGGACGGL